MRYWNRLAWTAAVVVGTTTPVFAQQGSVITTPGGQSTGSLTGTGGLTGGQPGQLGGGGGGGLGGGGLTGTQLTTQEQAPQITAPSLNTAASSGVDASNFLSTTYGNPYYQGILANSRSNIAPGGFGAVLYGTGGGGAGGNIGFAGGGAAGGARGATGVGGVRTTGALGATTALGGRGGVGGFNAVGGVNSGVVVPLQVQQMTFPTIARFATPPVQAPQLQADLTGMLARTVSVGGIANPAGVQVIMGEGNNVILRGVVQDAEEARLVEGMIRLTPGVRAIKNELTYPAAPRR